MQRYTVYFIWKLLHILRVVPSTYHQKLKELYLQHLVFVTPLLLSAAIVRVGTGLRTGLSVLCTAHSNQFQLFHDSGR